MPVRFFKQTIAILELAVIEKQQGSVTGMIAEMDRGGIFQAEPGCALSSE